MWRRFRKGRVVTCEEPACWRQVRIPDYLKQICKLTFMPYIRTIISIKVNWGYDFAGNTRTVDTHIKTLRQKLGSEGKSIVTLIRSGYKFEVAK